MKTINNKTQYKFIKDDIGPYNYINGNIDINQYDGNIFNKISKKERVYIYHLNGVIIM